MACTRKLLTGLVVATFVLASNGPIAAEPAIPGYLNYDALRIALESIGASDVATLSSLGQTLGGRDVFSLTLSTGDADTRPAILVVGNVAAPHLVGSELAVRLAKSLVDRAATDSQVKRLLTEQTIYIIPRPTPDASEAFFQKPWRERSGNVRPTDDDRDGAINEDPAEDQNGDGLITMMRVEDPIGEYIVHPDDPRVLIKADATKKESGQYKLWIEGVDNDGDESWGEDGPGGVDFNRNFTFRYPFFKVGAGPHQVSEPETRAVADFCYAHPNIYCVLTFSPHDNLAKPWKTDARSKDAKKKTTVQKKKTAVLKEDAPYYKAIAKRFVEFVPAKAPPSPPGDEGSFVHWVYFHYGRWSLGTRGWWIPETGDGGKETGDGEQGEGGKGKGEGGKEKEEADDEEEEPEDKRGEDDVNALRWFAENDIDGFVDWVEIEHPDFPDKKVEIGGFRPFVRLNPPAEKLDALATKHADFLLELAAMRPRLTLAADKVESLGEGTYRVVATIRNVGFLPTMSAMGKASRLHIRLQAEITLPDGAELVTGSPRVRVEPLAGSGGHAKQEWLFIVPGEAKPKSIRITAGSPTLGTAEMTVELP